MTEMRGACLWIAAMALSVGCGDEGAGSLAPTASVSPSVTAATTALVDAPKTTPPVTRDGSAIARAPDDAALYIADEDHGVVRRLALPLSATTKVETVPMPGPPAQVVALDGKVLVTIRDPGLLLILAPDEQQVLREVARVALAADAWGLAVSADEQTAIVSSAWTHRITGVSLAEAKVRWEVDVAREPRGVTVLPDGRTAYVSHLMGAALTRLEGLEGPAPKVTRVALPAARARAPYGHALEASLGYSLVSSPDGQRLYAPRHALGALSTRWATWWGVGTVDVLLTATDAPLAPERTKPSTFQPADGQPSALLTQPMVSAPQMPVARSSARVVQPRAAIYRQRTRTLLVASEGNDELEELDATGVEPALLPLVSYPLNGLAPGNGRVYEDPNDSLSTKIRCRAPSGVVLSRDERDAFVFCRSTYDLAVVALRDEPTLHGVRVPGAPRLLIALGDDPLLAGVQKGDSLYRNREAAALGRRLFYDATDETMSEGMGCAGCHPEGRDDGRIWLEVAERDGSRFFVAEAVQIAHGFRIGFRVEDREPSGEGEAPRARQTPMLAGRVDAKGPYGWEGEDVDLAARLRSGFALHRFGGAERSGSDVDARTLMLGAFLRKGLAVPPRLSRELTELEQRGKAIFTSAATECATCHPPATGYTDRVPMPTGIPQLSGHLDESKVKFKTPSLAFVGGTPPYFHNGSAPTLEDLVRENGDRMGKTRHLSQEEQAALVAFLKTL